MGTLGKILGQQQTANLVGQRRQDLKRMGISAQERIKKKQGPFQSAFGYGIGQFIDGILFAAL